MISIIVFCDKDCIAKTQLVVVCKDSTSSFEVYETKMISDYSFINFW